MNGSILLVLLTSCLICHVTSQATATDTSISSSPSDPPATESSATATAAVNGLDATSSSKSNEGVIESGTSAAVEEHTAANGLESTSSPSMSSSSTEAAGQSKVSAAGPTIYCDPSTELGTNGDIEKAREFLEEYNKLVTGVHNRVEVMSWAAKTNITVDNTNNEVEELLKASRFYRAQRQIALCFNDTALELDKNITRQLFYIKDIGTSAMEDEKKQKKLKSTKAELENIYAQARVCPEPAHAPNCLAMEPDLTHKMAESRDYDELLTLWIGWRNQTGAKMKSKYQEYVELSNEAVNLLGYNDLGEYWRSSYESPTFESEIRQLLDQIHPLYMQLHAYVRRKLRQIYGEGKFPPTGHIPAHILGDMWAQHWNGIRDLVMPFEDKVALDVTPEMKNQNYTVQKIFRTAEDFFVSLGMEKMTETFWNKSNLDYPTDGRAMVCHASAWDFYAPDDFRIKMCTDIDQQNLLTVHHEMGHIQYYMNYKDQPVIYRAGANPGFHEAIGDVMSLSVQTPEHLHKLGLLQEIPTDEGTDINFLMSMALQKIVFLPFEYVVDLWRWSVFRGSTSPETYNRDWWDLRCRYQGIFPPVSRSEEDFDAASKYHVAAGVPYIRYFVSYIIQFQFFEAVCNASGYNGPLHKCDIYNSTEAGELLRKTMALGASEPWPEAMKVMTGQPKMDAGPLLRYFEPLQNFLREKNGNDVGWQAFCPTGHQPFDVVRNTEETKTSGGGAKCLSSAGERTHLSLWLGLLLVISHVIW